MTRLIITLCTTLVLSFGLATVSFAHKVNIFAFVDGNSVMTDSGYSRSRRVIGGTVEVYDAKSGTLLLSGTTDSVGKFDFEIPAQARSEKMDLRLVLKAGVGHQAEWTVSHDEYGATESATVKEVLPVQNDMAGVESEKAPLSTTTDVAELEKMVQATVHRELAPVKMMLADLNQSSPGMSEIMGGIGYIVGIFGIIAYMKSRKEMKK